MNLIWCIFMWYYIYKLLLQQICQQYYKNISFSLRLIIKAVSQALAISSAPAHCAKHIAMAIFIYIFKHTLTHITLSSNKQRTCYQTSRKCVMHEQPCDDNLNHLTIYRSYPNCYGSRSSKVQYEHDKSCWYFCKKQKYAGSSM